MIKTHYVLSSNLTYCAIILKSVKINKKPTSDLYNNHQKTAYLIKTWKQNCLLQINKKCLKNQLQSPVGDMNAV